MFLMRERRFVSKNLLLQAACVEIYALPAHALIPWLYLVKLKYVNYFWAESRSKILLEATVKAVLYVLCMCIALLTSPPNPTSQWPVNKCQKIPPQFDLQNFSPILLHLENLNFNINFFANLSTDISTIKKNKLLNSMMRELQTEAAPNQSAYKCLYDYSWTP